MRINIPNFSNARILVIGDLMLDRYWRGQTSRISPEAPVPVVKVEDETPSPGGAGNVALNLAELGAKVTVIGLTGEDEAADTLEASLNRADVVCQFVRVPGARTIIKLRVLSHNQQLLRIDFEDGFDNYNSESIMGALARNLDSCDVIILSDYGKGALQDISALIDKARKQHKIVLVDPKGADFSRYRGASGVTPNLTEFEAVVGPCKDEHEFVQKAENLRSELKLAALVITRSDKGMTLLQAEQAAVHFPTHTREIYDVTGAGDTVISVLGAALGAGMNFYEAAWLANLGAGVVVSKLGTATVSIQELQSAMLIHEPLQRGIVNEQELRTLVEKAHASGERVVLTNGCFDILHTGHIAYLSAAAQLGDRLIIAVNDDSSVQRIKGSGRPINKLQDRMQVLAGIESVDWIVPFVEDTPERLVCRLKPDILVKGGDYKPEEIAGSKCTVYDGKCSLPAIFCHAGGFLRTHLHDLFDHC